MTLRLYVGNKYRKGENMEINVVYTAKDGRRFNDPYECEEYEKRLGTQPGTVGRARIDLKDIGEQKYVFGILKVRHEGSTYYRTYVLRCVDDKLENYVNVDNLDVDKRWIRNTIGDVLRDIEQFNDDDLCEYDFLYGDHWEFGGKHTFSYTQIFNPKLWDEIEKDDKAKNKSTKKKK